jgi:hypothetical protein
MLSAEKIKEFEDAHRINFNDFVGAINDEKEVDFGFPEISVYTKEELDALKKNISDQNYVNGLKAANDIAIKEAKKKYSLEFEGKDWDNLLEAHKRKIVSETAVEPNKKIQELETVNTSLKASLAKTESKVSELENTTRRLKVSTNALNSIQKEYNLPKNDILSLMMLSGYDIDEDNGKIITSKNGETVRDPKTHDPMPFDAVFEEFAKEKRQIKADAPPPAPKGRGDKSTNTPPAAYGTFKEFETAWIAQGKSVQSAEFAAKAQELSKNNPDFFK